MTYNQFWLDDPQLYYIYEEAYLDKLKEQDIFNWQLGQYIHVAISSNFDDKGRVRYPKEPVFFAKQESKPKTVFEMRDKFLQMVAKVNKNF